METMNLIWATDLHLSFCEEDRIREFERQIADASPDAILLGGDIGEAPNVASYLQRLNRVWECPVYFVLGNHDFYHGGIASVRQQMAELKRSDPKLHYLSALPPVMLTSKVALIGHDGWADGREGDYHRSLVMMNDYRMIDELAPYAKRDRLAVLHRMGDEAAEHVREQLRAALAKRQHIFLLTHVPPFREACWYEGQISDDEWAPHFVCQAMGHAILDLAKLHPESEITVLCGHTHSPGTCQPVENVRVITGGADYGRPRITRTFKLA